MPSVPHPNPRQIAARPTPFRREGVVGRSSPGLLIAAALLLAGIVGVVADAARAQSLLSASSDVPLAHGPGEVVIRDDQIVVDNQLGIVAREQLGPIPEQADVIAYDVTASGTFLLAFDTTVQLIGGVVARPGDLVEWDGNAYAIFFSGASVPGFPPGARIDAASEVAGGHLLSFDTDVQLGSTTASDEDVVLWNGTSASIAFDGSAAGLDSRLDVDGVQAFAGGEILVSFDTAGTAPGAFASTIAFQDEDILRFVGGAFFTIEIDVSALDEDWGAAELDAFAVPEPSGRAAFAAGAVVTTMLALRRRLHRGRPSRRARSCRRAIAMAGLASTVLAPAASVASDGTSEINQTCATQTGCFPGDAPGFPVTIDGSAGRRYRLTSDLGPPGVDAIILDASFIEIDLAGHSILGPTACNGWPLVCTPISGAEGIVTNANEVEHYIHDGAVRGMTSFGIVVGHLSRVEDVRVESNGRGGIGAFGEVEIRRSVIRRNGGYGVIAGELPIPRSVYLAESIIQENASAGVHASGGLFLGNTIQGNEGSGIELEFRAAILSGNFIRQNLGSGIRTITSANLILENVVDGNSADGIDTSLSSTAVPGLVLRNDITSNGSAGLRASDGTRYRANVITADAGSSTVVAPIGTNLGANACNGTSICPP